MPLLNKRTFALVAIALIITLAGCDLYTYRPVSSFKITDSVLRDGDTIDITYCSGGPQKNDQRFYYHLIAERTSDKKKVNLLVDDISSLTQDKSRKIFVSSTSDSYKYLMNMKAADGKPDLNSLSKAVKPRDKVVVGSNEVENNDYLTAIGTLCEELATVPQKDKDNMNAMLPDSLRLK